MPHALFMNKTHASPEIVEAARISLEDELACQNARLAALRAAIELLQRADADDARRAAGVEVRRTEDWMRDVQADLDRLSGVTDDGIRALKESAADVGETLVVARCDEALSTGEVGAVLDCADMMREHDMLAHEAETVTEERRASAAALDAAADEACDHAEAARVDWREARREREALTE